MTTEIQKTDQLSPAIIESLILKGDISGLSQVQKVQFYRNYCERIGLDPASQPFKILKLQGKETLYLDRSGAQQLNKLHKVSHQITSREKADDLYIVCARASTGDRFTESIGAVNIKNLSGDTLANAMMKAETKAKRRSTLDLLGLGILDETEVETIPKAITVQLTGESVTSTLPEALNEEIRDLSEAFNNCKNINQIKELWKTLSEAEKVHYKSLKERTEINIAKEKFAYYVDKLDKTNFDKNRFFLESIIDDEKDTDKKHSLMLKYNSRLEELGIEEKYELLPFEEK